MRQALHPVLRRAFFILCFPFGNIAHIGGPIFGTKCTVDQVAERICSVSPSFAELTRCLGRASGRCLLM